jgi:hypothetical protein
MKCKECGEMFGTGEMDDNGMCWVCSAMDERNVRAMNEDEAFSTLSTNELVAGGYIDAATMNELFAPWESEVAVAA